MATTLSESETSEIIEMALSDHVSFQDIQKLYGLREKDVKKTHARKPQRRLLQSMAKKGERIFKSPRALQVGTALSREPSISLSND